MYIECVNNNNIKYLRIVESKYEPGRRGPKKTIIKSIGPLSKYDDGEPNYVERLKESFKLNKPIIPELQVYCTSKAKLAKYKIEINEGSDDCIGHPKLICNTLLEKYLEELGLISFFNRYKQLTKIEFDLVGFLRLLVFGRILKPSSKISTTKQNADYFNPLIKDMYKYNVYDTLDFIYNHKSKILNRMNKELTTKFGRTTNAIYYDVTNFFFETAEPDDDILDDNNEIIEKGIRKMGVSKENRKQPIVQMGMFIDDQGIPISLEIFPGNTLDHLTVIPSLDKSITNLNLKKYIFVGDRGMYRGPNTYQLSKSNNGYIISKSIEKTKKEEKDWIYNSDGYIYKSKDFKYKSKIITREVIDENKTKQTITEQVVVYWNKKFYEKQVHENKSMLDFLEKFKIDPTAFRLSSINKSMKKFIKKEYINTTTGEIIKPTDLGAIIDEDKVNKYVNSFGYYQIVTSELDMNPLEVIEKYSQLNKIEAQFRIMKSTLDTRPIYVRNKTHIEAHLFICMISLTIIRLIQNKIVNYKTSINDVDDSVSWTSGLEAIRLIDALNKWKVDSLTSSYYRFNDIDDKDLKLILDSFDIKIDKKLYTRQELRTIKTDIKLY